MTALRVAFGAAHRLGDRRRCPTDHDVVVDALGRTFDLCWGASLVEYAVLAA